MKHKQTECKDRYCSGCYHCELTVCKVCGLFEGSLTTHCPGQKSFFEWADKVYKEGWDFKDGKWYKTGDKFEFKPQFEEFEEKVPKCHFTPMTDESADNGDGTAVDFWECKHCGHTKLISQYTRS